MNLVFYHKKKTTEAEDRSTLRITLSTDGIKDILYDCIFDIALRFSSLTSKQTYILTKEKMNKDKKKTLTKVLKLSADSILIFYNGNNNSGMIKREIPYSAVQSFYIDNEDKEKLYINFMNKGNKKSHIYRAKKN